MTCNLCRRTTPCSCAERHAAGLARDGRPRLTAQEAAEAKRLQAEGLTYRAIAKKLGRTQSSVCILLRMVA